MMRADRAVVGGVDCLINIIINIFMRGMGVWVQLLRACACYFCFFCVNDDAGFLGSPPHWVVYPPGSTLGEYLPFTCGE